MNESGIYTETDLKPFQSRLEELKTIITSSPHDQDDELEPDKQACLTQLLLTKWDQCSSSLPLSQASPPSVLANTSCRPPDRLLAKLVSSLVQLSPELAPVHQRLITLRRLLASIASRVRPSANDITTILVELRAIEDKRSLSGKFTVDLPGGDGSFEPMKGQALCVRSLPLPPPPVPRPPGAFSLTACDSTYRPGYWRTTLRSVRRSRREMARRTSHGAPCSRFTTG